MVCIALIVRVRSCAQHFMPPSETMGGLQSLAQFFWGRRLKSLGTPDLEGMGAGHGNDNCVGWKIALALVLHFVPPLRKVENRALKCLHTGDETAMRRGP